MARIVLRKVIADVSREQKNIFNEKFMHVFDLADYDYDVWEQIYKDIQNGKCKDASYFKDYDADMKFVENAIGRDPYEYSWGRSEVSEMKRKYENVKQNYLSVVDTFNSFKIGDKQDDAIEKLIRALKNQKRDLYDEYTKEQILKQIEDFKGHVVIDGPSDLNIFFKDGKVVKKEF